MKTTMGDNIHQRPHSTPKVARGQSSAGRGDHRVGSASPSLSLDETGESTRSLLSILSHSSIKDLPEDELRNQSEEDDDDRASDSYSSLPTKSSSHSSSRQSKPSTSRSRSRSPSTSRSKSQTDTYSKSSSYSLPRSSDSRSTSQSTSGRGPQLSPWEKWLIEKTKEERKRLKEKARLEREKQLKLAEEKKIKAEKAKVIRVKVNMWIEERTAKEQESKRANQRLEETKRQLEAEEKRRLQEKAKENYAAWSSQKKAEKEMRVKKEKEERQAKEEAERKRKEEAEDAYLKWKEEAKTRPLPLASPFAYPRGCIKGYQDKTSYAVPGYCNPIPWMPIHTPQEHTTPLGRGQRGRGKRTNATSSRRQIQQPLSPPLLFRDRSAREKLGKRR
ncbi:coiled-coil domain-containing protein 34-like [Lytechinus variegatus]|uniref:coiled-coil domain-containing protein 34-like n=1 Tax=Lytechinus variegatus TaxID=7654 RepID=UPI001BB0ECD5|nr:coiled-coil domain-containing protein 34-like [Lytechinus variegatus]